MGFSRCGLSLLVSTATNTIGGWAYLVDDGAGTAASETGSVDVEQARAEMSERAQARGGCSRRG